MSDGPPALVTAGSASRVTDAPQVALLRDAIRRQRKLAISYEDARGSLSDRTVWPIALVYFDAVRVLAAWCEQKSAFRHFRVDRLRLRAISEERYPGRRQSIVTRWRRQDRDWRSILTVSDASASAIPDGRARDPGFCRSRSGSGEKMRIAYDESRSLEAVRAISKRMEYDFD